MAMDCIDVRGTVKVPTCAPSCKKLPEAISRTTSKRFGFCTLMRIWNEACALKDVIPSTIDFHATASEQTFISGRLGEYTMPITARTPTQNTVAA